MIDTKKNVLNAEKNAINVRSMDYFVKNVLVVNIL